jgi:hypothetical protein
MTPPIPACRGEAFDEDAHVLRGPKEGYGSAHWRWSRPSPMPERIGSFNPRGPWPALMSIESTNKLRFGRRKPHRPTT